jgi:cysteine desulfurase
MTRRRTYLDWNATAPLRPAARAAMLAALDGVGNPSSVHTEGRAARRVIEDAREQVAALAGASPRNVYFTSGATEANAWVHGQPWRTIVFSRLEHVSVLASIDASTADRREVGATRDGVIDLEALAAILSDAAHSSAEAPGRAVLTVQAANNETGVVQPLAAVIDVAKAHGMRVASDAVQMAGRARLDFDGSGLDYMTISAHKLGGPKGVGAVIARPDAPLAPMMIGGGQERRLRAGTENVAAIAGFGAAAEEAARDLGATAAVGALRDRLEAEVCARAPNTMIIGREAPRLPNTTCLALPGRAAETLVAAFDLAGVAVSAGSACSSGKVAPSHVLSAMGLDAGLVRGAIRISLGATTTTDDIAAFLAAFDDITARIAHAA